MCCALKVSLLAALITCQALFWYAHYALIVEVGPAMIKNFLAVLESRVNQAHQMLPITNYPLEPAAFYY